MKERKDAQQAYINAMNKLKMPADIDLDKKIIVSGSSKVKMKSKAFAYAALAAVLIVCIAVGAIVLHNRDSDSTPKIGSSRDMTLEKDDTIPSGLIMSVPQAIEQHQRCMLLLNDEYIKLKANRDNITKNTANSFIDRRTEIEARDKECLDYIDKNANSKQIVFVHAVMYDNGETSVTYHIGADLDDETFKALDEENNFWLCDAKTGEKIYRCASLFAQDYGEKAGISEKIDTSKLSKLSGEISLVSESSKNANNSMTLIKSFKFFDKLFINTSMREELAKLALKASDKQDNSKYENAVNISADKVVCSQHGVYMRLTVTAANDIGKTVLENNISSEHGENRIILQGDGGYAPKPDMDLMMSITSESWETVLVTSEADKVTYDCYLPITIAVDVDFDMNVYAAINDPMLTNDDTSDGDSKEIKIGSVKVKYEKPMKEREFVCGDKKLLLSDLCFAVGKPVTDVTELTLKKSDGTSLELNESDFTKGSIEKSYINNGKGAVYDEAHKNFCASKSLTDNVRACFIAKTVDTSKVTAIVYAGEEYKLNADTQYKTAQEAKQAFEQAYNGQLYILQKYKSEKDTLSVKQMCEEFDDYLDTIGKAGEWLSHQQNVSVLARRTTANELVLYLWNSDDFSAVSGSTMTGDCAISADGKQIARGKLNGVLITPPEKAGYEKYTVITVDCKGSDLSAMKTNQQYTIAFNYNAGGTKDVNFTLETDTAEMPLTERLNLLNEMQMSVNYKAFNIQK
ncbi:MAG: hypothetical protein IJ172_11185 [Ruminococcus sp.]|nr:hypothetical protein [Ruminococcus sp.]